MGQGLKTYQGRQHIWQNAITIYCEGSLFPVFFAKNLLVKLQILG